MGPSRGIRRKAHGLKTQKPPERAASCRARSPGKIIRGCLIFPEFVGPRQERKRVFARRRSYARSQDRFLPGSATTRRGIYVVRRPAATAITEAHPSQFDQLARTVWKAIGSDQLSWDKAGTLAEAIEARRADRRTATLTGAHRSGSGKAVAAIDLPTTPRAARAASSGADGPATAFGILQGSSARHG